MPCRASAPPCGRGRRSGLAKAYQSIRHNRLKLDYLQYLPARDLLVNDYKVCCKLIRWPKCSCRLDCEYIYFSVAFPLDANGTTLELSVGDGGCLISTPSLAGNVEVGTVKSLYAYIAQDVGIFPPWMNRIRIVYRTLLPVSSVYGQSDEIRSRRGGPVQDGLTWMCSILE